MKTAQTPQSEGSWKLSDQRFCHLPIHMALLRTGKVLAFGGSGNDEYRFRSPHPFEIWDPGTDSAKVIDQSFDGDLFCVGQSFLQDGRLLVAGGTRRYDRRLWRDGPTILPFRGLDQAYTFDPLTETFERTFDLSSGRWYPTLITLGDGRVLAVAGLSKYFPWAFLRKVEVYSPETGWKKARGASKWMPLYPHLHLLPSGDVFYTGSYNTHYEWPWTWKGFPAARLQVNPFRWTSADITKKLQREEGASVLLPLRPERYAPRILMIGGAKPGKDDPIEECWVIDFDDRSPDWKPTGAMKHARYYSYASLLPDGKVLVLGGKTGPKGHHAPGTPVLEPEVYDPADGKWTAMASMTVGRDYHSNSVLLPDGRVMAAGSNVGGMRRKNELRIEMYSPPYLHRGSRPQIDKTPPEISVGHPFEIESPQAKEISEAVLIRPTSTTHCTDTDQRFIELIVRDRNQARIVAELPDISGKPYLAPTGYYMLFVLKDGVPSTATFIRVVV